eukprot:TRINITY_DN69010_c0_g1_i1.p1 TRINITY_DN69010_c0_g1~~TRINITY_DN69010_c0_g1_i1.p1  ORF type:complete len:665 (-),score=121.85 TRINITY_DN69010_c0_g1_i1:25-2019(-)
MGTDARSCCSVPIAKARFVAPLAPLDARPAAADADGGFVIGHDVASSLGLTKGCSSFDQRKLLVAWRPALASTVQGALNSVLVGQFRVASENECDNGVVAPPRLLRLDGDTAAATTVASDVARKAADCATFGADIANGDGSIACELRVVPDYWVPPAKAIMVEVSATKSSVKSDDACLVRQWELDGFSGFLRQELIRRRVSLRSGQCFFWSPPCGGTEFRCKATVELPLLPEEEETTGHGPPSTAWAAKEWRLWLHAQGVGLIGDLTAFTLIAAQTPTESVQAVSPPAALESPGPPAEVSSAATVEAVLRSAGLGGQGATSACRRGNFRSVAVITRSLETPLASLQHLYPGFHTELLSAAVLSRACGHRSKEANADAARRWLLARVQASLPLVLVLLRPTSWFGDDADGGLQKSAGFGNYLKQFVDMCRWRASAAPQPGVPSVVLVSLLEVAPPRRWERLGLFDAVVSLDIDRPPTEARGNDHDRSRRDNGETILKELQGLDKAKTWLNQAIGACIVGGSNALNNDNLAGSSTRVPPSCVAFHGPASCGKTSFLGALMELSSFEVLPLHLPTLLHAGLGETQAAVRAHFARAMQLRPSCVTLDDADELFAGIGHSHSMADLLFELAHMIDQHCSPRLVFVATCVSFDRLPPPLASRLHAIPLER